MRNLSSRINQEGVLHIHVEESRSQLENKELAREKLIQLLTQALKVPKKRKATKPTKASQERRVSNKRARSAIKNLRKKVTED